MVLLKDDICSLRLMVTGYQFPDAIDPQKRFSWHLVEGAASVPEGTWDFEFPALTCEETPTVSTWLDAVADWLDGSCAGAPPPALDSFMEPNLVFHAGPSIRPNEVEVAVDLDLEFKPPWLRTKWAGSPYSVRLSVSAEGIRQAAADWVRETSPYPDLRDHSSDSGLEGEPQ